MTAPTKHAGFTLIEILVVAGLIVLLSALAIPAMLGNSPERRLDTLDQQFRDFSRLLTEQALFNGIEYALAYQGDTVQLYQFDLEKQDFIELDIPPLKLPELQGEVQVYPLLDEGEQSSVDTVAEQIDAYRAAQKQRQKTQRRQSALSDGDNVEGHATDNISNASRPVFHAMYFSNGEVTPHSLELIDEASGTQRVLDVNIFGEVIAAEEREEREQNEFGRF